ncbi:MAG: ribosome small subunit-dependent GTPase A [Anaerolineales bacterium]
METERGLVIRSQSGFYWVQTPQRQIICHLRGRLKKDSLSADRIAIGDWVQFTPITEEHGVIEAIEPRQRRLSRNAPNPKGDYEQIIIANPDQMVLVFACSHPEPHLGMLDRYLIIAEKQAIPALIVVNKVDLLDVEEVQKLFEPYPNLGYRIAYVSAKTGTGIEHLRQELHDKISVFTGPSGVGKSSLLNRLIPGWNLKVKEVQHQTHKGRHSTVVREMYPLAEGGFIADTPGLKALALWDIQPEELDGYFPEMRALVSQCAFNDCTHTHEPDCAILNALKNGKIHPSRYQSYLNIRNG